MAQTDIPKTPGREYNGTSPTTNNDLSDIRKDLESLKDSVLSLSRHLQRDGKAKAGEVKSVIDDSIDDLLEKSDKGITAIAEQVKENPRRALAMAFAAGFVINLIMRKG